MAYTQDDVWNSRSYEIGNFDGKEGRPRNVFVYDEEFYNLGYDDGVNERNANAASD